ncbi:PLP-dependent aminotransferase family protein [Mycobacterium sp. AZCC_0083]|jgi:GntR family transcriptional regulator/MocR family aminotransferase|uniref:MocR-like pyridoxine biosynthesis transcription factor PdxR n=1 Tax=Mycobacterium sp. AZCC_0083 TaxID=2735882 RepID=UPI0018532BD1|nr:PLP-dependent aminotransferase family protein [Mycobacterium sp. AZCC_0083]MBB5163214.1 GntR family transcriptional regulator/MocR family aminotransferase [Mycobacterium sp. AZCC_0083]
MSSGLDIPITVDRNSPVPLREQIVSELRGAIRRGLLQPGYPMPSTRLLAQETGLSRTTIVAAYLELEGEGWVEGTQGSGTFVAHRDDLESTPATPRPSAAPRAIPLLDLRPGDLDPSLVALGEWRAAWRKVVPRSAPPPAEGTPELRSALASYLGAARGLPCEADDIFLCAGTAEAMVVLALAFGWVGRTVVVEEPGYPAVRAALTRLGVDWVPVDATNPELLRSNLDALPRSVGALYITPSHQYPLGHRLDSPVRRDLLDWAQKNGAVIVEDDYDAEFRFGVPPLPSLAGLDEGSNVVFMGTMSKVLDPGLRLTYLRVPGHLRAAVAATRNDLGSTVAAPTQEVVADLITTGVLTRHIARVRKVYADRRRVMLRELKRLPAISGLRGIDAGLHLVADLHSVFDTSLIARQARARNLLIAALDEYRVTPDPANPALVLGYAKVTPTEIKTGIGVLAEVLDRSR